MAGVLRVGSSAVVDDVDGGRAVWKTAQSRGPGNLSRYFDLRDIDREIEVTFDRIAIEQGVYAAPDSLGESNFAFACSIQTLTKNGPTPKDKSGATKAHAIKGPDAVFTRKACVDHDVQREQDSRQNLDIVQVARKLLPTEDGPRDGHLPVIDYILFCVASPDTNEGIAVKVEDVAAVAVDDGNHIRNEAIEAEAESFGPPLQVVLTQPRGQLAVPRNICHHHHGLALPVARRAIAFLLTADRTQTNTHTHKSVYLFKCEPHQEGK